MAFHSKFIKIYQKNEEPDFVNVAAQIQNFQSPEEKEDVDSSPDIVEETPVSGNNPNSWHMGDDLRQIQYHFAEIEDKQEDMTNTLNLVKSYQESMDMSLDQIRANIQSDQIRLQKLEHALLQRQDESKNNEAIDFTDTKIRGLEHYFENLIVERTRYFENNLNEIMKNNNSTFNHQIKNAEERMEKLEKKAFDRSATKISENSTFPEEGSNIPGLIDELSDQIEHKFNMIQEVIRQKIGVDEFAELSTDFAEEMKVRMNLERYVIKLEKFYEGMRKEKNEMSERKRVLNTELLERRIGEISIEMKNNMCEIEKRIYKMEEDHEDACKVPANSENRQHRQPTTESTNSTAVKKGIQHPNPRMGNIRGAASTTASTKRREATTKQELFGKQKKGKAMTERNISNINMSVTVKGKIIPNINLEEIREIEGGSQTQQVGIGKGSHSHREVAKTLCATSPKPKVHSLSSSPKYIGVIYIYIYILYYMNLI